GGAGTPRHDRAGRTRWRWIVVLRRAAGGGGDGKVRPAQLRRNAHERNGNGQPSVGAGYPEQQERWLRPICEGRMRCAIAMTEPEAGSAATEMTTTASLTEDGEAYCVNGSKIFISGGKHADVFITYARFGAPPREDGGRNIGAM